MVCFESECFKNRRGVRRCAFSGSSFDYRTRARRGQFGHSNLFRNKGIIYNTFNELVSIEKGSICEA